MGGVPAAAKATIPMRSKTITKARPAAGAPVAGDTVASTGALGGIVQLGGVAVSRDFSLDPYFVRFLTLDLSEEADARGWQVVYADLWGQSDAGGSQGVAKTLHEEAG